MKLTKTLRQEFVNAVLQGEVKAYDFAERIAEVHRDMIATLMPMSVAEVYKNPATRGWVSQHRVADLIAYVTNTYKGAEDCPAAYAEGFEKIDRIEIDRAEHYRNIDNIRQAIDKVCESVTTVAGVAKLLPQYSNYLPKDPTRPTRSEAVKAAETAETAVAVANIGAWRANPKKAVKKAEQPPSTPAKRSRRSKPASSGQVQAASSGQVQAAWPFPAGPDITTL
jgi:hypothetical protein